VPLSGATSAVPIRLEGRLLKIGVVVVTMSYQGLFTVVEINDDHVTIVDGSGDTKIVRVSNVRRVDRDGDRTS
jgi:hypothetical protein